MCILVLFYEPIVITAIFPLLRKKTLFSMLGKLLLQDFGPAGFGLTQ